MARVLSLDGELERDQRCLVVKRKRRVRKTGRPLVWRKPQREEERG